MKRASMQHHAHNAICMQDYQCFCRTTRELTFLPQRTTNNHLYLLPYLPSYRQTRAQRSSIGIAQTGNQDTKKPCIVKSIQITRQQQQQKQQHTTDKRVRLQNSAVTTATKRRKMPTFQNVHPPNILDNSEACLIFTDTTADGRDLFIVNDKFGQQPAYTQPLDAMMDADPDFQIALNIDTHKKRVDPTNPNKHLLVLHTNNEGQVRTMPQTVYLRLHHHGTSPAKRQKWITDTILPLWNEFGKKEYGLFHDTDQTFTYGGDLATTRNDMTANLADYITLDETFQFMSDDYGQTPDNFRTQDFLDNRNLLELFFGSIKTEQLLARQKQRQSLFDFNDIPATKRR